MILEFCEETGKYEVFAAEHEMCFGCYLLDRCPVVEAMQAREDLFKGISIEVTACVHYAGDEVVEMTLDEVFKDD